MSLRREVLRLEHSARIDLFVLDLVSLGGATYRFCNHVNELQQPVVWQGVAYQPMPIESDGWEKTTQGPLPRPTLRVSDLTGLVGVLVRQHEGLAGAPLIRKRTLARYLDAANFAAGNPSADPNSYFPDQRWVVARRARDNGLVVEFELRASFDLSGVMVPARQIIQNVCTWQYRSAECGYTGPPVADRDDQPTASPAIDRCGKRLSSCRLRFGQELPIASFPTAGLTRL
jgi:lambda family phage minor tail protein L